MDNYLENNRWKILGIGFIALFLVVSVVYLLPEMKTTVSMYQKMKNQREQISSVQNWQIQLEELRKKKERLESYFSDIYVGLPSNDQMSTIIEELFQKAREANVRIVRIQPSERREFKSHSVIPITIDAGGSYHHLGTFIQRVEQSQYLIKIRNCILLSGEENPSQLRTEILVQVIILKSNNEQESQSDA